MTDDDSEDFIIMNEPQKEYELGENFGILGKTTFRKSSDNESMVCKLFILLRFCF